MHLWISSQGLLTCNVSPCTSCWPTPPPHHQPLHPFLSSFTCSLHPASIFARWNSYLKQDSQVSSCCLLVWTSEMFFPWSCGKRSGHLLSVIPMIAVQILLSLVGPSLNRQCFELLWQSWSMGCLCFCPWDSLRFHAYSSVSQQSPSTGPSPVGSKIELLGNFRELWAVCSQALPVTSMRWMAG